MAAHFDQALESGLLAPSVTSDIYGGDENRFKRTPIGGSLTAKQRQTLDKTLKRSFEIGASMFNSAEQINRATAWIAAYTEIQRSGALARFKKMYANDQRVQVLDSLSPENVAGFVVRDTQFIGGKLDRPLALRGIGGVAFQFKTYPINYMRVLLGNAFSQGAEGKMAGAMMLTALVGVGGVMGIPFAEDLTELLELVFGDDDDPMIEYTMFKNIADLTNSQYFAEVFTRGFGRNAFGLDLSQRIGMGKMAPETNLISSIPVVNATYGKLSEAYARYKQDQPIGAVIAATGPFLGKGGSDLAKGLIQLPSEGYQSRKDDLKKDASEITGGQILAKALGFNPTEFARIQNADYQTQRLEFSTQGAKQKLSSRLASQMAQSMAAREDDDEERAEEHMKKFYEIYGAAARKFGDPKVSLVDKVKLPSVKSIILRAMIMRNPKLGAMRGQLLKRQELLEMQDLLRDY